MTVKYKDPEAARAAQATLAKNREIIEGWGLTAGQLSKIACAFAWGYIADSPEAATTYHAEMSGGDPGDLEGEDLAAFRDEVIDSLSWQMVGASGSDEQRELSRALTWAEGYANS